MCVYYATTEAIVLNFKRILSIVLMLLMIESLTLFGAYATSGDVQSTQDATDASQKPTEAPTKPPVTVDSVGHSKYIKTLESTYYKGDLGATYEKSQTTFKVWSPLASRVKLCIYKTGTDQEEGATLITKQNMHFVKQYGTWVYTYKKDLKNYYYTYEVTINGKTNEVVDPYAKAVGANGNRGMIVDLSTTNPKGWENDKFNRVVSANDAVIWEVSVRDFSASQTSGVSEKNRGKFLAFTEKGTTVNSEGDIATCVDYLKQLGVNYVQINPFYDFASIDETDTKNPQYNWGYDPKNYNVPEGSYSSNPYDGNVRIKECKQMIQALHNAGIGVIMDVVYNHTYESENSFLNQIVPDYYYRMDEQGNWSNGSGCGNDTASERIMFREFMKNSVMYWAQEYHIDGFRFDLMGLHDVDTMNYIRTSLDALPDGNRILMYGEPWKLDTACDSSVKLANQDNLKSLSTRIGAFNDRFRDGIKGSTNGSEKGFVQDGTKKSDIRAGIEGMSSITAWSTPTRMSVNYASCHDNLTLYDKLVKSVYKGESNFRLRKEDLVSMNKLSAAIVLTSQGMPFMVAGEEMARSKDGDHNSYKSSVELNQIDWNNLNVYADLNDYYKGLIDIRNTIGMLTDESQQVLQSISYVDGTDKKVVAYTIKGTGATKAFAAVFNGGDQKSTVTLPDNLCKTWVVIADENRAGIVNLGEISDNKVVVQPHSCVLLVNKSSFDSYKNIDKNCQIVVRYHDSHTNAVFYEQILKGKESDKYAVEVPNKLLYRYNVIGFEGDKTGTFKDPFDVVTVKMEPYQGDYSSVTFHFVDENDNKIHDSIVSTNRVGQMYTTPQLPSIAGYRIDLNGLPSNGAGEYTKEPIVVVYRYKSISDANGNTASELELKQENMGIANVIYMSDTGEIFETKSYKGDIGEKVKIEYLEFEDYTYVSSVPKEAKFSANEVNIILNYEKESNVLMIILIIGGGILLICGVVFLVIRLRKKPHRKYVSKVGDDLLIEE